MSLEYKHAGSTEEFIPGYKPPFWLLGLLVAGLVVFGFVTGLVKVSVKEPVEEDKSIFSSDCTFYRRFVGGDFVLSEPKAGSFRYEVYATKDGIEVWKCDNF